MNDIKKQSAVLLSSLMGQRLVGYRKAAGYKSARNAWLNMKAIGIDISYFRYCSLEDGGMPNSVEEMWAVAGFLDIDVACWMEGVCELEANDVSGEVKAMFSDIHRYSVGLARRLGI